MSLSGLLRWTGEHAVGAENLPPVAFWWARGGGLGVVGNVKGYCRQVGVA